MRYQATLQLGHPDLKLLITDPLGDDRLKAVLPATPNHPRALLTLLEGVALWTGSPLSTAIAADRHAGRSHAEALFGEGVWPVESALVHFDFARDVRPRRIRGPGDFRQLYLLDRGGRCA